MMVNVPMRSICRNISSGVASTGFAAAGVW
jgi:hypothetical protein